jgi:mRNA interferase MazF
MNRGEVWWIRFSPSVGGEIQKTRPTIILSNDRSNKYLNRLQVVPLSSKVDQLYPSEVFVTLEGRRSKALADQLTTVSKLRCVNKIGRLSDADLRAIESVVKRQLDL